MPVIFAIQALNRSCNPMAGVVVEIWHTNCEGFYSADNSQSSSNDPFQGPYCANYNARAQASRWHRGAQITNGDGVAYFKSCFPGWYSGRTNHIHLAFIDNGRRALATQLSFEDALCNEIHINHPEYIGRRQDTSGTGDIVFGQQHSIFKMQTSHNPDGSMLAYKSVIL